MYTSVKSWTIQDCWRYERNETTTIDSLYSIDVVCQPVSMFVLGWFVDVLCGSRKFSQNSHPNRKRYDSFTIRTLIWMCGVIVKLANLSQTRHKTVAGVQLLLQIVPYLICNNILFRCENKWNKIQLFIILFYEHVYGAVLLTELVALFVDLSTNILIAHSNLTIITILYKSEIGFANRSVTYVIFPWRVDAEIGSN